MPRSGIVKPQGAFYLFPETPIEDDAAFVDALRQRNVLTVPGRGPAPRPFPHFLLRGRPGARGCIGGLRERCGPVWPISFGGGVSGLHLEDLPQQPRERSLPQINHYVVWTPREHRLSRFVGYVPFNMGHMSWHENKVPWASVHVFFEILSEVDPDLAAQHVGCGLCLTVVVWRSPRC